MIELEYMYNFQEYNDYKHPFWTPSNKKNYDKMFKSVAFNLGQHQLGFNAYSDYNVVRDLVKPYQELCFLKNFKDSCSVFNTAKRPFNAVIIGWNPDLEPLVRYGYELSTSFMDKAIDMTEDELRDSLYRIMKLLETKEAKDLWDNGTLKAIERGEK